MARAGEPPRTFLDRLFIYGIRSVIVVLVLVAVGIVLIVHGWSVGRWDYVASGAIIAVIGIVVGVAAMRTSFTMITKPYVAVETLIGKTGKASGPIPAHGKGVVHIEHETWSAVAEEEIGPGEWVVVTAVDPDKVTLRVRKRGS